MRPMAVSMRISTPVRPMPAEQCTIVGSTIPLLATRTRSVNSKKRRESSGTPWSGHAKYCIWLISRSSLVWTTTKKPLFNSDNTEQRCQPKSWWNCALSESNVLSYQGRGDMAQVKRFLEKPHSPTFLLLSLISSSSNEIPTYLLAFLPHESLI